MIEHRGAATTRTLDTIFHGSVNGNRRAVTVPRSSKAHEGTCCSERCQHPRKVVAQDLVLTKEGKVEAYRTKLTVSFKYEGGH